MLKYATALLVILTAVSFASAQATDGWLSYTTVDLGGDLLQATFYANSDDTDSGSYAILMGWEGLNGAVVNQIKALGTIDVNMEANAAFLAADAPKDSYALNPFTTTNPGVGPLSLTTLVGGFNDSPNLYEMSVAIPGGTVAESGVTAAQIVFDLSGYTGVGNIGHWLGVVARQGSEFEDEGFVIPEPATMALLGMGGVAALIRRRR